MNPLIRTGSKPLTLLLLAASLAAVSSAAVATGPSSNPTSISFAAGGTIRMKLDQGDMEVVGVPDDKITISWRAKSPRDESAVSVKLARSGSNEASLSVEGPGDRVHYRIEVPRQSNISIEMNAGELAVQGVTGSLGVEMMAGEMELRVADSSRYRNVRAAVLAGEITARPWTIDISGVARSFKVSGDGEYDLRAELLAGQITIRSD
jgi:hypothetical protein